MKLIIDISKDRYDEIMAMDWKNCRRFFDEEIRAIHDGIPQRTGRWVSYPHQKDRGCSICGHSEPYKFADKEAEIFNYCPNCGCAMKGESEQEPSHSENPNKSEIPTSCSTCILDNTDACTRGAGRAVDDEACEDYLASPTGAEGSEEE